MRAEIAALVNDGEDDDLVAGPDLVDDAAGVRPPRNTDNHE
jgi:hypothetical protein